jgi:restriction system protein
MSRSFNLFDLLPWYFWPAVIGLSVFKALGSTKRRRPRKQRTPAYSGRGRFTWNDASRSDGFSLGKLPKVSTPKREPGLPVETPDVISDVPVEWSLDDLATLEWKRFETVCAEYLHLIGFDPKETRIGADGGVDVWVYKEGVSKPVGIVQCKAWTTYKVGVKPVRELFGVMAAEGVANGKFITSGEFTSEAIAFAEGKRLQLISGEKFINSIRRLPQEKQDNLLKKALDGDYRTPSCPQCGFKMTRRQGKDGGRDFWGCPKYPRCKSTLVAKA